MMKMMKIPRLPLIVALSLTTLATAATFQSPTPAPSQGAQTSQEPYPGQGQHATPPDGWQCMNQNISLSVPPDHVCSCERMKKEDGTVVEDQQCKVFCHADHCSCAMADMTKPHEGLILPSPQPQ